MSSVESLSQVYIEQKQGKGRSFQATYVASVKADKLWDGGKTGANDIDRPVFAVFLGTENEVRPFVANLTLGRRALLPSNSYKKRCKGFEFLKTAGYKYTWQRETEGSIVTIWLPELFLLDPGMVDPKGAKFVILPPKQWAAEQKLDTPALVTHARQLPIVEKHNTPPEHSWERDRWTAPLTDDVLASFVPLAYLFAAYLDRRTRAPLLADGRFYLQVLIACLDAGLATLAGSSYSYENRGFGKKGGMGFEEHGMADAGFVPGLAFRAAHTDIEPLLADEIALYFRMTER